MKQPEINPKIEELMWLEIDETISPSDREELYAHLESHPDARGHFENLRRMTLLFGQVGEIDPPSELHERILRALENAAAPARAHPGLLDRLGAFLAPRPAWRYAVVAGAGILVGMAGYHLFQRGAAGPGAGDVSHFYGSISVNGRERNGHGIRINSPGVTGTLAVRRDRSQVLSRLDLNSAGDVEVVLAYEGRPIEFAVGELPDRPRNQVFVQDGEFHVWNQGSGAYRFLFAVGDNPDAPVIVTVLSEGAVVYEGKVSPEAPGEKN